MPSHLTRIVFRSIVADTPLLYRGCQYRSARSRLVLQHGARAFLAQRRTFFGLFTQPRKTKDAELPAGLETMSELAHAQKEGYRTPDANKVAKALIEFFAQKRPDFEDFHVQFALNAYRHLLSRPKEDGQPWLSMKELDNALYKLRNNPPQTGGQPHLVLGKLLFEELMKITEGEAHNVEAEKSTGEVQGTLGRYKTAELPKLVRHLCTYGASLEARDLAIEAYRGPLESIDTWDERAIHIVWDAILRGLAKEGKTAELQETTVLMKEQSVPLTPAMQVTLVTHFAEKKDLEKAKYWYSQPIVVTPNLRSQKNELSDLLGPLLKACALCGDVSFGQQVVASLLEEMPDKAACDAIYLWSAAIGKGPDEIDRMMNVLIRRNQEKRQLDPKLRKTRPDIDTINMLVEFAMFKQDPYLAERYVALGEKRGILPNERTSTLQIQYRLSIQDLDGARTAYYGLQGHKLPDDDAVKAINQLVQALCHSPHHHHFDDIMSIIEDMAETKARLTPETVATICLMHLRRGETHDAVDLLQVHSHHFSPAQRIIIRESLADFILDGQTSTTDAWDGYQMLRNLFPETPRSARIPIMNEFFTRKRSDMACHVFFHMRNSLHENITTTREVYVAAFTGFARNQDAESLELAHNQLKLDLNVEMDTQLRNALMLAYAATGNNKRALEFWAEIGASKEGPTYNSIAIAFRSCEGSPFGDNYARAIWKRLKEMDVDIDKQIWTAHMSAIARNHLHDEALGLIESAEKDYGFTPDLEMWVPLSWALYHGALLTT